VNQRVRAVLCSVVLLAAASCESVPGSQTELEPFVQQNRALAGGWDELWIVSRQGAPRQDHRADSRLLATSTAPGAKDVELELTRVDIRADVLGRLGSVRVRQVFAVPFEHAVDLAYELAIPEDAAVTDLLVRVGGRRIRAVVRERDEAERLYHAARARGLLATLVTRQPSGRFLQRIGTVPRCNSIEVEVEYLNGVPWTGDWCELDLPAAPRRPIPVNVTADIEAGVPIEEFDTGEQPFSINRAAPGRAELSLSRATGFAKPCRIRWRVSVAKPHGALFVCRDAAGGDPYFLLTVYGPVGAKTDWQGLAPYDVRPERATRMPSTAVAMVGRLRHPGKSAPRFVGSNPSRSITVLRAERLGKALPQAWAWLQISGLAERSNTESEPRRVEALLQEMRETALAHGLISYVTSFVMIDARSRR